MKTLLEKAINRYLALDPESRKRIALLENKIVTVELLGVSLTVQLIFTAGHIQLKWNDFLPADLTIRGTPLNLLHLSIASDQRQKFFAEDVVVEGNMELAQQVLAIFDDLEIDWENYLSQWTGDVPAHHMGRFLQRAKIFSQKVCRTLLNNTNEYVHEEANLFPPREELQDFFREVDELRMAVDRLGVRVDELKPCHPREGGDPF